MKTQPSLPGMADLKTTKRQRKLQVSHVDPDPVQSAPPDALCAGEFVAYCTEQAIRAAARLHRCKVAALEPRSTTTAVTVHGGKTSVIALVMEMKGRRMLVRDEWSVTLQKGTKR